MGGWGLIPVFDYVALLNFFFEFEKSGLCSFRGFLRASTFVNGNF